MSDLNIFQRMLAITTEMKSVSKNLSVGTGKSSYKAVGEADVLAAVKKLEEKHGVYSYPISRKVIGEERYQTEKEYTDYKTQKTTVNVTNWIFMRIETTYRFVNVDKPEEFIETISYGDGLDTADKCSGKAMTYADKYALMKAYKIITGDDPDQNHSDDYDQGYIQQQIEQPNNPGARKVTDKEFADLMTEISTRAKIVGATPQDFCKAREIEVSQLNKNLTNNQMLAIYKKMEVK